MVKGFWRGGNPAGRAVAGVPISDQHSAVLGAVEDYAGFAGAAGGILDRPCAPRSGGGQVGTEGWSRWSNIGMVLMVLCHAAICLTG